jgi:hypothetical protein
VTALSPRQQAIAARLAAGPATTHELEAAAGYEPGSKAGSAYVCTALGRLGRRGYYTRNLRPRGSQRGGYYVLMSRPKPDAAARIGHCVHCGAKLNRWNSGRVCWPCQWSAAESELAAMHGQLELVAVAS